MSSARHPQTDGQTERVNQCMEGYLRCFVHSCQTKWVQWLHLAEFWYNTSYHSSLKKTPFEVLYGHAPRVLGIDRVESCAIPQLEEWLEERHKMTRLLQHHLERVQQRMKAQADKGRTERSFEVGDEVFLKLQPYLQSSVAHRANHKLAFKFYGPFMVEQKVGKVAYKLKLPKSSMIHPVIHVSQLKKFVPHNKVEAVDLPNDPPDFQAPEHILDRRYRVLGSSSIQEGLVRWSGMSDSLATWENLHDLRRRFPNAPAWGQAGSEGERNVTNPVPTNRRKARTLIEKEIIKAASTEDQEKLQQAKRERRRNARFSGPEWTA